MKTIAVYNLKGGVGKTTFAVNFAWASANISRRRTLLWDLDPQSAATHFLTDDPPVPGTPLQVFEKGVKPEKLARPSRFDGIDVIAADFSLSGLDRLLFEIGKKKRLVKLLEGLQDRYDRVILDCPPGLGEVAEHILRSADIVIVPVIPSTLSHRAFEQVVHFLNSAKGQSTSLLPVHSMVDRRRTLHREALVAHPDWPVIPMASVIEQMAAHRAPIGAFAPGSPSARAFAQLWTAIERKIA